MLAETKAACGWFPMKTFTQHHPPTDAELDHLGDFLKGCKGGKAMNVEALDGFFAALIAGPETVMPSEYYPEVFGGEMSDACEFGSLDEANEILGLMMRHWNTIAGTLFKGEVYVPLLLEDETGTVQGNDWAGGFMRGMGMRHDGWAELVNDEEHGGCLIPMMMLCHEPDEDPEMRPEPISPGKARRSHRAHGGWAVAGISVLQEATACRDGCPHVRASAQHSEGREERSVPVRLGEEVQEMLRRGDCELMKTWKQKVGWKVHTWEHQTSVFVSICRHFSPISARLFAIETGKTEIGVSRQTLEPPPFFHCSWKKQIP
jgi:uncharacterized protein